MATSRTFLARLLGSAAISASAANADDEDGGVLELSAADEKALNAAMEGEIKKATAAGEKTGFDACLERMNAVLSAPKGRANIDMAIKMLAKPAMSASDILDVLPEPAADDGKPEAQADEGGQHKPLGEGKPSHLDDTPKADLGKGAQGKENDGKISADESIKLWGDVQSAGGVADESRGVWNAVQGKAKESAA